MTVRTTGDVVDVLLMQHGEIEDAFDEVTRVEEEDRAAAFDRLRDLLVAHEEGEQKVVHPLLREHGGDEVADARLAEEHAAEEMLAELNARGVEDPGFEERLDALRTAVLDHAHREQDTEFVWLRAHMTEEQLHRLADQLRSARVAR